MSRKYIKEIINQNFIYPNNRISEYDIELVQDINDNSVSGSVDALTVTSSSSFGISLSMNYTWNLNGAERFIRNSNRMSILSVHAMSPNQLYFKPFRTVFEISISDTSLTTYSQTGVTFTIIPSDLGLSAFTEGTYNFEVRFIGHSSIYPICLTVPVTFTPTPTPTATPVPGPDCYLYSVSNIASSTRSVTYTTCEGVTTTSNVPAGGDLSLGCVRENTVSGNLIIVQGELCTPATPTPTSTSTPTPTPTPTTPPASATITRVGSCTPNQIETSYTISGTTGSVIGLSANFSGQITRVGTSNPTRASLSFMGGSQSSPCYNDTNPHFFNLTVNNTLTLTGSTQTIQSSAVTYNSDETLTSLNVRITSIDGSPVNISTNGCRGDSSGSVGTC